MTCPRPGPGAAAQVSVEKCKLAVAEVSAARDAARRPLIPVTVITEPLLAG